jgi:predicted nucleic acid-binding protein
LQPDHSACVARGEAREHAAVIRKTADLIIGTYCIEHGHTLLHDDRDFDLMHAHLGLQVL